MASKFNSIPILGLEYQKPYPIYDQNGRNQLKSISYLRPKRLKNPTLWGRTYLYSPYKGIPPPPTPVGTACCSRFRVNHFRGSLKYFNSKFSFTFRKCFHVWTSRELEFALCSLQNTSLLNHARECDHMRSPFSPDKQSHVTKIVDLCRRSQPPRLSLNSRPTCFGSIVAR